MRYTLYLSIPSHVSKIETFIESIYRHSDLDKSTFKLLHQSGSFIVSSDSFDVIAAVRRVIELPPKKYTSTSSNQSKSKDIVVKKPIHPDIVANNLIARTIGKSGCFMREIQERIGQNNVQRISVGDKPGNYVYTIYASSQTAVDDTYLLLQKHEFDVIKECIPQRKQVDEQKLEQLPEQDEDDNFDFSKPIKTYPPGTSWVDMMDDDDE